MCEYQLEADSLADVVARARELLGSRLVADGTAPVGAEQGPRLQPPAAPWAPLQEQVGHGMVLVTACAEQVMHSLCSHAVCCNGLSDWVGSSPKTVMKSRCLLLAGHEGARPATGAKLPAAVAMVCDTAAAVRDGSGGIVGSTAALPIDFTQRIPVISAIVVVDNSFTASH